jgi:hypothetical protein
MTHSLRSILRFMLLEASDDEELYFAMLDRYKRATEKDENWKTLWQRLTGIGGKAIIIPSSLRDEHLVDLIRNGQGLGGVETLEKMEPHQCHKNTALLYDNGKVDDIVTGYALSEDGFWRQHTWGLRGNEFIETTAKRVFYYGVILTDDQAEKFVKDNTDATDRKAAKGD